MILPLRVLSFLLLSKLAAAQAVSWDTVRDYAIRVRSDGVRYVADELLIGLAPSASRVDVVAAIELRGARLAGEIGLVRALRIVLPEGDEPLAAVASFAAIPGVRYAETNDVGEGGWLGGPSDTFFPTQWHLENTGQPGGTAGADIEVVAAWSQLATPAPIVLAVLDTGIDFSHPEFQARVVPGFDYVNEDADATADHPHGIFCAGLAAAATDNAFGVAGVDETCTIYPLKVLNGANGGTVVDLVQALEDCATNQVDVVSMSLINYGSGQTLENALIAARNAGCVLVACAGNGGAGDADVSGPGRSDQTMSIGWTAGHDDRAFGSATGSKLDFVAPGEGVRTVSATHNDTWAGFSGCSAATPVAAGIVCLLKGQDPTLTHAEVFDLLKAGAEDQVGILAEDTPGKDEFMGWGRLNARRSIASLSICRPPSPYGTGKTTSLGTLPVIGSSGEPRHSFESFAVTLASARPNALAVAFHGPAATSTPWFGGTLLVAPPLVRLSAQALDASGAGSWPVAITAAEIGTQRFFQTWFRDPSHPDGTNVGMSNALSVTYCP